jgi:hypothetical protein
MWLFLIWTKQEVRITLMVDGEFERPTVVVEMYKKPLSHTAIWDILFVDPQ